MLLVIDIGNSRIKFGTFDGERLVSKFSIPTVRESTVEDLVGVTSTLLPDGITNAIFSSVVPELNTVTRSFLAERFGIEPTLVTNELDFGMQIDYDPLADAGSDRLVNSFSALEKYGAPCVVCSFGTAMTIDAVSRDRILKGGVIAPGIKTLSAALNLTTSRLPEVEVEKPAAVLQNTTIGSLQSGIVHGYLGLVETLLSGVIKEIGDAPKVIATGGFAPLIAENTELIDVVDPDLTLEGLARLHRRLTS